MTASGIHPRHDTVDNGDCDLLDKLGFRLDILSIRVNCAAIRSVRHPDTVDDFNRLVGEHDRLRKQYRAALARVTGESAEVTERRLSL